MPPLVDRSADALHAAAVDAVKVARLFNRSGATWLEYDAALARLERAADDYAARDEDRELA